MTRPRARLTGSLALAGSALYLISDVIEAMQGGFSDGQLWLTLIAEAVVPVFVIGLVVAHGSRLGPVGRAGAFAYAYAYMAFTASVVYALVGGSADYGALNHALAPWMTIHGAIMVFAGIAFGAGVIRARILPRWTGVALITGVVAVAASQGMPELLALPAVAIRDLAFAGMGVAVLRPLYLQWGSSATEQRMALPGDELVPGADLTDTVLAATEPCGR